MTPAAFTAQANGTVEFAEALRAGANVRVARATRRPRLFNDYTPGAMRLFHAWRP